MNLRSGSIKMEVSIEGFRVEGLSGLGVVEVGGRRVKG